MDLDPKAVEIAQLNLLLQISERKQRLPILQNNIKVGNSLIDDPNVSDKAFKWEEEFPEIMKEGGFDIVIGNPPYINIKLLTRNDDGEKVYYKRTFNAAVGNYDLYVLFIEKGISLLKIDGFISFIVPNKFMVTDYGSGIRKFILEEVIIKKIVDVSSISVFKDIGTYPIIFVFKKESNEINRMENEVITLKISNENDFSSNADLFSVKQKEYADNENKTLFFGNENAKNRILKKIIMRSKPLSSICTINSGTTGFEYTNWGKYITEEMTDGTIPFIVTGNIEKYVLNRGRTIRYQGRKLVNAYFKKGNEVTQGKWELFSSRKIVIRGMALSLTAAYDEFGCACGVSVYTITKIDTNVDLFYLLGVLNSRLIDFFYKSQFISKHLAGGYIGYNKGQLEKIPIVIADETQQNKISALVKEYITNAKVLFNFKDKTDQREEMEKKLDNYKNSIDSLVYEIYNINKSEIRIIENTS